MPQEEHRKLCKVNPGKYDFLALKKQRYGARLPSKPSITTTLGYFLPIGIAGVSAVAYLSKQNSWRDPSRAGSGEGLIIGQSGGPLGEGQITGEDHAAALIALGHDVEEQARFLSANKANPAEPPAYDASQGEGVKIE